jgi:hypothetical protein
MIEAVIGAGTHNGAGPRRITAATDKGAHDDDRFSQRRFKRGMQITQLRLLSSWVP